ncbi:MAG: hypothetical protein M3N48_04140, partial [Verrucomicrobiota bacterium]|nr:hypothetical protein [Verrucomicrobiota bacterium]
MPLRPDRFLAHADAGGIRRCSNGRTSQADRFDHPPFHEHISGANIEPGGYGFGDIVAIVPEPLALALGH